MNANRNKRSVVAGHQAGRGARGLLAIARGTTCWSTTFGPQAMGAPPLSYDEVRAVTPRLIYVGAFRGYSQRGPYAAKRPTTT